MNLRALSFAFLACIISLQAVAMDISNRYRSPRNPERNIRKSTRLIVLHTTEAPSRSSLNKLSERGECHYCVTEEGTVYRIVDRDREAFHAGRSMWKGEEDVDRYSIGIECVGHHDQPMGAVQLKALAELVRQLMSMYGLDDAAVVTHSQVAYGAPNKWQKKRHRGRKRCGMLFATPTIRRQLNLKKRVTYDPDVRARRLVVADDYLNRVLYGGLDIMARHYAPPKPTPKVSAQPATKPKVQPATKPKQKPKPKAQPATPPKAKPEKNAKPPKSVAELEAAGYKVRGTVSPSVTASKIVGSKWNAADTYYTIRDKVRPGNEVNAAKLEVGTKIWRKPE